jgi:hypothetical protein
MLAAGAFVACGGTTVSDVTAPSSARCGASIAGLPASVGAGAGTFAATIAIARECAWKADADSAWVRISPDTGQGETAVTVVVTANPTGAPRTASLTVNGTNASVRQEGAACRVGWKQSSVDVPAGGGTVSVDVSATAGCEWQASSTASWLRGTRTSGTGEGTAEFIASANEGPQRIASLRLGDVSMTVTQLAVGDSGSPVPPSTPGPLIATYVGTTSGTHNFDNAGALNLVSGTYRMTFNRPATIFVRGAGGGGGGAGGKRRDDGGSVTAGAGGGGGGAVSLAGQPVSVAPGTMYEAAVGAGGGGGAGATEASGNVAGNGHAGSATYFRVQGGTVFLQLAGGSGGSGGTTAAGPGGGGGAVIAGLGVPGGGGGNGGVFGGSVVQPGGGTAGLTTGGGGGGGQSNEQSSNAGGASGGAGGASGGAPGSGARGGNAGNGASDSGGGGEGARDSFNDDSAGGGGGGGKGVTISGGAPNRGGGGGGGGAINTSNSLDRAGSGGAGGDGGMSIAVQPG